MRGKCRQVIGKGIKEGHHAQLLGGEDENIGFTSGGEPRQPRFRDCHERFLFCSSLNRLKGASGSRDNSPLFLLSMTKPYMV